MKRGIHLLNQPRAAAVEKAIACFDQALEMRRRLPIDDDPILRYGLAACWLNRADALARLGDPRRLPAAIESYDEGITLARGLPLGNDPRFPRRLAIALQNRGLVVLTLGPSALSDAIRAFQEAIAVLDRESSAAISDRRYLLAAVWTNLASARAAEATVEGWTLAREAAYRALALVADREADDPAAAEVGLMARHVLCRVIARSQSLAIPSDGTVDDDVHEATDVVDEGLALARRWEQRGVERFRGLACDLFRFGARVYARHQPHFLGEFVEDNMDPAASSDAYVESAEMQSAAAEALRLLDG